ncbi:DUF4209 domain-containing protein [Acinetobacter oleivorans]|uniref:DUF4209 domain-containing protein n=1 Tax=Acinetobacter oleivorans TaxID=1148157 RepID=UPI003A84A967
MTTDEKSKREIFLECNWSYNLEKFENYYNSSISLSLDQASYNFQKAGKEEHSQVLKLLSNITSMYLNPESIEEPFKPSFVDYENNRSTFHVDLLSIADLEFMYSILDDIQEPILKSRIADLLWILHAPRNPDHARKAIDSYTQLGINKYWFRGINHAWERAISLSRKIGDNERLQIIKDELFKGFEREKSNLEYPYLSICIARLLDETNLDKDYREKIAIQLFAQANENKNSGNYDFSRQCYDLASRKYKQSNDQKWIDALHQKAICYEQEAKIQTSKLRAKGLYEDAIKTYRAIPKKNRIALSLEEKPADLQKKMLQAGKEAIDELKNVESELKVTDISEEEIIKFVGGKERLDIALLHFIRIHKGPNYSEIEKNAKALLNENFFLGLSRQYLAEDGRTIERIPALNKSAEDNDPKNITAIKGQMVGLLIDEVSIIVRNRIMPALFQITKEFRINKAFLKELCEASPIVPEGRARLIADGLWYGFDYDFSTAVHLLSPQIENIVRLELQKNGEVTTIFEKGVQNEIGLSSLMGRRETILKIFGENLAFEIECIFTESIGFNLRNKIAHGLLNDLEASHAEACIYAWWLSLRIILNSLFFRQIKSE